jgi:hypothetical protein
MAYELCRDCRVETSVDGVAIAPGACDVAGTTWRAQDSMPAAG